jgi:hypothetical protein
MALGNSGLRVVADNTPLVRGSDDAAGWLRWDSLADRSQSRVASLGVCPVALGAVRSARRRRGQAVLSGGPAENGGAGQRAGSAPAGRSGCQPSSWRALDTETIDPATSPLIAKTS